MIQPIASPQPDYLLAGYHGESPPAPEWFDWAIAQQPERSRFQSGGAGIELLSWGERGKPGLLLLHGNGAHADWWSFIAPFLAKEWRCAALSWSGMGRSDRRPGGYNLKVLAQEAADAVDAAGLDEGGKPPIVIGHSLGGLVALGTAAVSKRFGGVVMIDTPLNVEPARLAEIQARAPKPRAEHRPFATVDDGLARFRLQPPQTCANDFVVDYIARRSLVQEGDNWYWHFDPRRVDVVSREIDLVLPEVLCPITFMYGERSAMLNEATVDRCRHILPAGTRMMAIPDAAHHVPLDQPLALVAALRGLLACWPECVVEKR